MAKVRSPALYRSAAALGSCLTHLLCPVKLVLSGEMKASPMPSPEEVKRLVPVRAPGWGAEEKGDGIKATWLGCVPSSDHLHLALD